jgi:formylglycine-generating enzyme required for sulfatase activity
VKNTPVPFDADHARAQQETWAKRLGVPIEITNSIGMKLRLIPPGELGRDIGARVSRVQSKPLYAGIHEVTVAEFGRFVKDTGYKTDAERVLQGGLHFAQPNGPALRREENICHMPISPALRTGPCPWSPGTMPGLSATG